MGATVALFRLAAKPGAVIAVTLCRCPPFGFVSQLRQFLIVLLNPMLLDPDYHLPVLSKVCRTIERLRRPYQDAFIHWLSLYVPASHWRVLACVAAVGGGPVGCLPHLSFSLSLALPVPLSLSSLSLLRSGGFPLSSITRPIA